MSRKGKPNLVYQDNKITNLYGVTFTDQEKRDLVSLVNSATRKRTRMLKEEAQLVKMIGGKPSKSSVADYRQQMGKESDFVLAKKSKSLQRFRNKAEYEKYVANLQRVVKKEYLNERVEIYKENYIKGIKSLYGENSAQGKKVVEALEKMPTKEYQKMAQSNEEMEISYRYSPEAHKVLQQRIAKAVLGNETKKVRGRPRNNNR